MFTAKSKGWVPAGESNEKTIKFMRMETSLYTTKHEASMCELGKKHKQVQITVICEDVKKGKSND